jgi:predicted nucleotide-binding protein
MKVFLSWSGEQSRLVAEALRDWLPAVIQAVQPWLSSEDISKGSRWLVSISEILRNTDVGIICLTRNNLQAAWLHFEAGALSKRLDQSLLAVYALDVLPSEVSSPLAQFQITQAEKEDTFRLIKSINSFLEPNALSSKILEEVFEIWWPRLEARLERIRAQVQPEKIKQPIHKQESENSNEKIDEILSLVRIIASKNIPPSQSELVSLPLSQTSANWSEENRKPRVFIGSSTEGLSIAEELQVSLDYVAECVIWNQGVFNLSQTVIEGIVDISGNFDFAIIVLTPDDALNKRGEIAPTPRDNLIFELGLFTGVLGRARTFMVHPRDVHLHLPSDLAGVTVATYAIRSDGNLAAALGPVCTRIKRAMGVAPVDQ